MAAVILLAEDEVAVRTLVRRILEQQGYKVHSTEDGLHALSIFEALGGKVDLVLTDVAMPRVGGRELARRLRASGALVPIAFMTGWALDLSEPWAEANLLLLKPFRPQELLAHVANALNSYGDS